MEDRKNCLIRSSGCGLSASGAPAWPVPVSGPKPSASVAFDAAPSPVQTYRPICGLPIDSANSVSSCQIQVKSSDQHNIRDSFMVPVQLPCRSDFIWRKTQRCGKLALTMVSG